MANLAALARALPGIEEGVACAGTTLESRTFHVRRKTFLFLSARQARLKLAPSLAEARALGLSVGANGWVTLQLDELPASVLLKRWITESHSLVTPPPAAKRSPSPCKPRSSK